MSTLRRVFPAAFVIADLNLDRFLVPIAVAVCILGSALIGAELATMSIPAEQIAP